MLTLIYDANDGVPIRDGDVEAYVLALIDVMNDELTFTFSTENIIHSIRAAIKEQRLDRTLVQLQFRALAILIDLPIDKDGRLDTWPDGFCDTHMRCLERLIDW